MSHLQLLCHFWQCSTHQLLIIFIRLVGYLSKDMLFGEFQQTNYQVRTLFALTLFQPTKQKVCLMVLVMEKVQLG